MKMLLFALGLMMLATAAARIPVKDVFQGICHMYEERCCISQEAMVCCIPGGAGGGYCRKFWIGVCREGS